MAKYLDENGIAELTSEIKAYVDALLQGKQPTLESGVNIKTINNESILGSGNISVSGGGGGGVTLDTNQTISGIKTFTGGLYLDLGSDNLFITDSNTMNYSNNSVAIGVGAQAIYGSTAVGRSAHGSGDMSVAIGANAFSSSTCIAMGWSANANPIGNNSRSIAIGWAAATNATGAIQLGYGTNSSANTFQVFSYQLLDASGHIPAARLSGLKTSDFINDGDHSTFEGQNVSSFNTTSDYVGYYVFVSNQYTLVTDANKDDVALGIVPGTTLAFLPSQFITKAEAQFKTNMVQSISNLSTNDTYPTALAVYNAIPKFSYDSVNKTLTITTE